MTLHDILKARTGGAHAAIDAAFSHFELGEERSYIMFLQAHARVVPGVEAALLFDHGFQLPRWRARTASLEEDLATFGVRMPAPIAHGLSADPAQRLGALYVLEGSRIGGAFLLRRVAPRFSSRFLAEKPAAGEWKAFIEALNDLGEMRDVEWVERAIDGALRLFGLYGRSAAMSDARFRAEPRYRT